MASTCRIIGWSGGREPDVLVDQQESQIWPSRGHLLEPITATEVVEEGRDYLGPCKIVRVLLDHPAFRFVGEAVCLPGHREADVVPVVAGHGLVAEADAPAIVSLVGEPHPDAERRDRLARLGD